MLVMDRGNNDYEWFSRLGQQGVWFVTRLKEDASIVSWNSGPPKATVCAATK